MLSRACRVAVLRTLDTIRPSAILLAGGIRDFGYRHRDYDFSYFPMPICRNFMVPHAPKA